MSWTVLTGKTAADIKGGDLVTDNSRNRMFWADEKAVWSEIEGSYIVRGYLVKPSISSGGKPEDYPRDFSLEKDQRITIEREDDYEPDDMSGMHTLTDDFDGYFEFLNAA